MNRSLPLLLDAHRSRLASCRRCIHDDDTVVPILSQAHAPRVMLVGQAPGKVELLDRRPFAGRAGRTLFRWLEVAGADERTIREHVYMAAITRCYPGPSPSGRGDRVPSPAERKNCREWLDTELSIIKPELLIPVGRLAIDAFLSSAPLDQLIGRAHDADHVGGRSLAVPLPHPSGASSWISVPAHRILLDRALRLLGNRLAELGITNPERRRSA